METNVTQRGRSLVSPLSITTRQCSIASTLTVTGLTSLRWICTSFAMLFATAFPALAAERVTYVHTDALGSPVAMTDSSGAVVERMAYEPYGVLTGVSLKDGPGYAGHVTDESTELSYMQQRYYDPRLGVFLSVDPVGASIGAFARYAYALGNPYRFIDPDGREPKERREAVTGSHIKGAGVAPGSKVVSIGGALPGRFTKENAQQRYQEMKGVVDATKKIVEGVPNPSTDAAARLFSSVYQKYSSRFGWEVSAEIILRSSGAYHLSSIEVSNQVRRVDWLGASAGRPLVGGVNIHTHPLVDGYRTPYTPFSYGDILTFSTTNSMNYVSDPSGVYKLNESNKAERVK